IWVPETVAETEPAPVGSRRRFSSTGGQQVVISSPAQAVAGARTPVMGVRTVARPKSIWFDTGDEDQTPAQAPVQEPDPSVPAPAPPPAEQEVALTTAVDEAGGRLPIYDSIES